MSQSSNNPTNTYLFEDAPIPNAIAALAVPSILSQLVTMAYNMADTFFIGQLGNPYMVAALSFGLPLFYVVNAIGNLLGLGGGSVISLLLGEGREDEVKHFSAFSFYSTIAAALIYSIVSTVYNEEMLRFLGASANTMAYAKEYLFYTVNLGAVPTAITLSTANMLRSDGHSKQASFGLMMGGLLNIALDPLFIFVFKWEIAGVAVATLISNLLSSAYYITFLLRMRSQRRISLSINPSHFRLKCAPRVVSSGASSALNTFLAGVGTFLIVKLSAKYGDIPLAAFGIVKKVDMMPINVSMGLCHGYMPLLGYNFAAKNFQRVRGITRFTWMCSLVFSLLCVVTAMLFAPDIVHWFIDNPETEEMGVPFLRIATLAVPMTAINFLIVYGMQAMGMSGQAFIISALRLGFINISVLLLMDRLYGTVGIISAQIVTETIALVISLLLYLRMMRKSHVFDVSGRNTQRRKTV